MANGRLHEVWEGLCGAAAVAVVTLSSPVSRRWYSKWGATDDEVHRSLPGDDIGPQPKLESTRAITVRAPAARSGLGWRRYTKVVAGCTAQFGIANLLEVPPDKSGIPALVFVIGGISRWSVQR